MVAQSAELVGRRLLGCLACVALAGCAALPPPTGAPPGAPSPGREAREANAPVAASATLLERSRNERAAGDYAGASASIERALRIEPNNPLLWLELGEIKRDDGDPEQAEVMARKALTLAGGDRSIETRANRLIAR